MKDGSMGIVEPGEHFQNVEDYRNMLCPSETTINFREEDQSQLNIRAIASQYPLNRAQLVTTNDHPNNLIKIDEASDNALKVTNELRRQRSKAQQESNASFQAKINRFFSSNDQGPQEPPPPPVLNT